MSPSVGCLPLLIMLNACPAMCTLTPPDAAGHEGGLHHGQLGERGPADTARPQRQAAGRRDRGRQAPVRSSLRLGSHPGPGRVRLRLRHKPSAYEGLGTATDCVVGDAIMAEPDASHDRGTVSTAPVVRAASPHMINITAQGGCRASAELHLLHDENPVTTPARSRRRYTRDFMLMLQERNAEQPPDLDMEIRPSPRDFRDFGPMLNNLSPCALRCCCTSDLMSF